MNRLAKELGLFGGICYSDRKAMENILIELYVFGGIYVQFEAIISQSVE